MDLVELVVTSSALLFRGELHVVGLQDQTIGAGKGVVVVVNIRCHREDSW